MKKLTALFLALLLVVGLLNFSNTALASEPKEEDILNEVGTYPIVKKPITMRLFTINMPNVEDYATNDFTKFMEEKTGIKMIFETASRDDWETKLNLAFGTDDYPDLVMFVTPNVAKYGVKEGMIRQLDDLIEKNMPNYVKGMGQERINLTRQTDGHIYGIASLNECYHCSFAKKLWANVMWLEKIGMGVPNTTEEFYEVCKKFLEINPNGIAIAGANKGWHTKVEESLINPFILASGSAQGLAMSPEGKIDTFVNKEEYREALRYIKSLHDLKAFYPGNFTQTQEQLSALANQEGEPVLFLQSGTISNVFDATQAQETYSHYQVIPPLAGPKGVARATHMKYSGDFDGSFFVTDKCKYPQAALRWVDYFFTQEGALSSQYGAEEGKDWVANPEGKKGLTGEPALYEVLNAYSNEPQNHDWQDVQVKFFPASFRLGEATNPDVDKSTAEGLEKLLYDATKYEMEPYAQKEGDWDVLPRIKLTEEEATEIQTIAVELENYIAENRAAFVTGSKDIENDWAAYVEGLEKLQLEKYLNIYQTAYDRAYK